MTCFICDPENPAADEEGCSSCEIDFWQWVADTAPDALDASGETP